MTCFESGVAWNAEAARTTPSELRWVRVTVDAPCYVCFESDGCGRSADFRLAFCSRVSEGAARQTRLGGYIHVLHQERGRLPSRVELPPSPPDVAQLVDRAVGATWCTR